MSSDRRRKLPHDPAKVCGSCRFLRRPIYYSDRLVKACEKVGKAGDTRTEVLAELTYEGPCTESTEVLVLQGAVLASSLGLL